MSAVPAEPHIDKTLLLYRGGKSAKPHREKAKRFGESVPTYREAEKTRNVSGKIKLLQFPRPRIGFLTPSGANVGQAIDSTPGQRENVASGSDWGYIDS
jgi:hypothetical protein